MDEGLLCFCRCCCYSYPFYLNIIPILRRSSLYRHEFLGIKTDDTGNVLWIQNLYRGTRRYPVFSGVCTCDAGIYSVLSEFILAAMSHVCMRYFRMSYLQFPVVLVIRRSPEMIPRAYYGITLRDPSTYREMPEMYCYVFCSSCTHDTRNVLGDVGVYSGGTESSRYFAHK